MILLKFSSKIAISEGGVTMKKIGFIFCFIFCFLILSAHADDAWHFVSEPNLSPPKVMVTKNKPGTAEGLIFFAPKAASSMPTSGQPGSLIMDREANPIWFRPAGGAHAMNTDFRTQEFEGHRVLTFWQSGSTGTDPCWYILDKNYRTITTITAQNGYTSDTHEFLITPHNTALFLSTKSVPVDLSPYGGPQDGYIEDFAIQEVDLKTNELLFFWSALENVQPTESYVAPPTEASGQKMWDPYHCNSVGLTETSEHVILSMRHTWTIYCINKPTGMIEWRLGGKQSDFTIESEANFAWQHDVRALSNHIISMFDDNCCNPTQPVPPDAPQARGLILHLNFLCKSVLLCQAYYHDPDLIVSSQGNVQSLDNGNKFIGWGQKPFFSEYKAPGDVLYNAQILGNNQSYRAYCNEWVGTPYYPPSLGLQSSSGQTTAYASWNGSTETVSWQVFSGDNPTNLSLLTTAKKSGFETSITVDTQQPYFQVVAINAEGAELARSEVVKLD